jgi:hypothetical protein
MTTNEFLEERTRERDRFELELGDAFDVKASIVLLILTFLGTISATMLTAESVTRIPKLAQIPVIAAIAPSLTSPSLSALLERLILRTRRRINSRPLGLRFLPLLLWSRHIRSSPLVYQRTRDEQNHSPQLLSYFPAISFSTSSAFEGSAPLNLISFPS